MARETKEERLVRGMTAQLTELLLELKALSSAPSSKETEVEVWAQTMLKSVLGFSAGSGYIVRQQETRGKMRFDLAVARADKPDNLVLVIEVKKLGSDLGKADFRSGKTQLAEYVSSLNGTRWGILTNGYEWRLYDFKSGAVTAANIDIRNDEEELDTSNKGIQETAWSLLDFSTYAYEEKIWEELSTEAQALSPDSLARCLLSSDIVNKVRRTLNEEHGYRATVDGLTDKLSELLEMGLNDLGSEWNDNKKAELDRYIRNQKRAAKRARKRKSEPETPDQAGKAEPKDAALAAPSAKLKAS